MFGHLFLAKLSYTLLIRGHSKLPQTIKVLEETLHVKPMFLFVRSSISKSRFIDCVFHNEIGPPDPSNSSKSRRYAHSTELVGHDELDANVAFREAACVITAIPSLALRVIRCSFSFASGARSLPELVRRFAIRHLFAAFDRRDYLPKAANGAGLIYPMWLELRRTVSIPFRSPTIRNVTISYSSRVC